MVSCNHNTTALCHRDLMKPPRNAVDLAASLREASATAVGKATPAPVPAPAVPVQVAPPAAPITAPAPEPTPALAVATAQPAASPAAQTIAPPPKAVRGRPPGNTNTKPVHLRIPEALLERYTQAAAARTLKLKRVVTVQKIMLERLEGLED